MILPNQREKMDQIVDLPTITCQNPGNLYNQISGVFFNPRSITSLYLAFMLIKYF